MKRQERTTVTYFFLGSALIIGAVACCLIPQAWPLGLIIGIGAIVVMAKENNASQPTAAPAPAPSGPQLSAMAVIAVILVSLPFLLLFFVILGLVHIA